jgi:hypothetical protein
VHQRLRDAQIQISYRLLSEYVSRLRREEKLGVRSPLNSVKGSPLPASAAVTRGSTAAASGKTDRVDPLSDYEERAAKNKPFDFEPGPPDEGKLILMNNTQSEAKTLDDLHISPKGVIHLSLQGKGGVGKSLVASIVAQYYAHRRIDVHCIDTDPVNQTLSQYRALNAQHLKLLTNGNVDQRGFDALMERLLNEDGVFVVDSGASTFIPLWSYILENNALDLLTNAGRSLYVHTVITGGQALADTLKGFSSLAESTSQRNLIVWINEYFGRVERDGKQFIDMAVYKDNKDKTFGWVLLAKRNQDTFGRDFEELISRKLTMDEGILEGSFSLMSKQRIRMIQRGVFEQLDALSF